MPDPLGDAARRRLTDAAASRLAASGFEVTRPDSSAEPPAVASGEGVTLGIEPLTADDATPTTVVSRLGHALDRDRRALFVVDSEAVAASVRSVLTDPPLLVAEAGGRRTFHAGPDRVPVDTTGHPADTGGYACVRVEGSNPEPDVRWRETDTPLGPVPSVDGIETGAVDEAGRPTVPRLVCEFDGRVVATLGGVESLRTPPASAVPYYYRRDPDDKRFRVRRGEDGDVVESVSGFAAMRAAGFVPVPMPLVPEHVLGRGVDVADAWEVTVAEGSAGPSDR